MKEVKVGDILAGTWGYSMRLVSFFKVKKVTPKQVVLQELKSQWVGGPEWNSEVKPTIEDDREDPIRIKNDLTKDYIFVPRKRILLYQYDPNEHYTEDHMD